MTGPPPQKFRKRFRMRGIAVFARDQAVFKDVPPARLFKVKRAGVQNFADAVSLGYGHRAGALPIGHGMQRDRKIERDPLLCKGAHLRHQAAGGKADIARTDPHSAAVRHIAQKAHDLVVVVKGLAAAHQHQIGDGAPVFDAPFRAVDGKDLAENLPRRKIAHESAERGGAELAPHTAADLRGDALRVAVLVLHEHPFDQVSVRKGKQEFLCAVLCREHPFDADGLVLELFEKRGAQGRRNGDFRNALPLRQPLGKLFCTEGLFPRLRYKRSELFIGLVLQNCFHRRTNFAI